MWIATHDDFAQDAFIPFSRRWGADEAGDGDWAISGSLNGVAPCPADALAGLINALSGERAARGDDASIEEALKAMHDFRAGDYRVLPGLERWWRAPQDRTPEVVRLASRDAEAREAIRRLFAAVPDVLAAPDRPLSPEHLRDLRSVLDGMAKTSPRCAATSPAGR